MADETGVRPRRRGIYLLPNLFTTGALFAGFYGIVASMNARYEAAAIAILVAMVLDGMDGRIARMTNTQSDFGAEYDSLSDMASFGLAPALIMYEWQLGAMGKIGWLAAFIYAAATALRLARFNTQIGDGDRRFFQGLPSPAAAAVIATLVWFGESFAVQKSVGMLVAATFVTVTTALLMVSNVRYYSFKDLDLRGRVPFVAVLLIVVVFVLISIEPATVLLVTFLGYMLSGPALTAIQIRQRLADRKRADAA
ncbi:MAG: CDP-diacylglycerol--serine O-phosphatidyltransferase [Pseudomonadota bacterium]